MQETNEIDGWGGGVSDVETLPVRSVDAELELADASTRHARGRRSDRDSLSASVMRVLRMDSLRRRSLALADALAIVVAYTAIRTLTPAGISLDGELVLVLAIPLWIVLNKVFGLYDRDPHVIRRSTLDELPGIAQSVALGSVALFLIWPAAPSIAFTRFQTLKFALLAVALTAALRMTTRALVARSLPPERCLIVGSGPVADLVAQRLRGSLGEHVKLVGFVDEAPRDDYGDPESGILGSVSELEHVCAKLAIDRVVIAFANVSDEELLNAVQAAQRVGIKVSVVPRLFESVGTAIEVDQIGGVTLHGLHGLSRTTSSMRLKRAMDLIGAGAGLLIISPLLIAIAVAIKLTSPGPVIFSQKRIGRLGRSFRIHKFRTMQRDAEQLKPTLAHLNEASGPMFKIANDPRITRVGRFMRRYSLDELPQLWNVVRGDMSLVGPRPLVPSESEQIIGRHRARLGVAPGLTGHWQVAGRTTIPFDEMVKLDYLFVSEWSLWNDVKLLIRTAPVVLRGDGQ